MTEAVKPQNPPAETPEQKKHREEVQKMALEMGAIDRTSVVLSAGIDFVARQMCRADEAKNVGEFLGYLRDLKRDMRDRKQVLQEAIKISRDNPVITEDQITRKVNDTPTPTPVQLEAVPS